MKRFTYGAIIGIACFFAGAVTSASKADVVYLGQRAEITVIWYACPLDSDLQRLKALSQESRKAAARFSKRHHCTIFRPGETGVVQNARVWTEDTCLRLKPKGDCYWFPEPFVKKGKQLVGADLRYLK